MWVQCPWRPEETDLVAGVIGGFELCPMRVLGTELEYSVAAIGSEQPQATAPPPTPHLIPSLTGFICFLFRWQGQLNLGPCDSYMLYH